MEPDYENETFPESNYEENTEYSESLEPDYENETFPVYEENAEYSEPLEPDYDSENGTSESDYEETLSSDYGGSKGMESDYNAPNDYGVSESADSDKEAPESDVNSEPTIQLDDSETCSPSKWLWMIHNGDEGEAHFLIGDDVATKVNDCSIRVF